MRYATNSLDYFSLLKGARSISVSDSAKVIRTAILADCATQQLATTIKVLGAKNDITIELYEGAYDGIDLEILNPQSGLYVFAPQYVIVLMSTEKLKTLIYNSSDRKSFATETVGRIENLWSAFRANCNGTIIQSTFVLPYERAFGNYELKVADSVGSIVTDINFQLAVGARHASNVLLSDVDFLAASVGRATWLDARMWTLAKTPCRLEYMPLLAQSLLDTILAASGMFIKCVVLDLDNTLWGGVIGDDGLNGIALGEFDDGEAFVSIQKFIQELKRRGIILAVVSKNDYATAISPFREHPHMALKEGDISVFIANWENKVGNIRTVQRKLNIGFDSLLFLDDNPFERNIVREYLPQVVVPELSEDPSSYLQTLAQLNLFETASYSIADQHRANQYREEAEREQVKARFTDIKDYLISLGIEIRLERFSAFDLPRIAQLIQRSNQFNLMTRRYGEAACEAMMNDKSLAPLTLKLSDKFGDYGLISVVILKPTGQDIEIDEYLMSCRVLQRGVENFAMNNIFAYAARQGFKRVVGLYTPTKKNNMVKDFFGSFGFEMISQDDSGATKWALAVEAYQPREVFMTPIVNELEGG